MNLKLSILLFFFFLVHASNGQSLHRKEMARTNRNGGDEENDANDGEKANNGGDEAPVDSSNDEGEDESFSGEKYSREGGSNAINVKQNASNRGDEPREHDKTTEVHGNRPRSSESEESSKSSESSESSETAKNDRESEEGPGAPESSEGRGHSSSEERVEDGPEEEEIKPVEVQFDCYPQRGNVLRQNAKQLQNRTVQMAAHVQVYLHCDRPRKSRKLVANFLMKCGKKESYFDSQIGFEVPMGSYRKWLCGFSVSAVCTEGNMVDISNVCEEKCAKSSCDQMPGEMWKYGDKSAGEE